MSLTILPLVFSSSLGYWVVTHEAEIEEFTPVQWNGIYALSALTMAFALTPTTLVALMSGYFLGWASTGPVVLAYSLASLIGYEVARRLDGGKLLTWLEQNHRARQVMARLRQREFSVIFLARLSPVLPFAVTNVLFSVSGTSRRNFLVAGLLGMLPRTMLSIWAGSQTNTIRRLLEHPNEATGGQWALLGLILVSLGGLSYVLRRAWR
ncbi:MAG: VTT domain-containing protein [Cytophagaceae bacterium]|nr:VTT domain-containing protein [Cytophagaceae bacterium]